ncbi:MAG: ABC transporter substrate-binding protein [Betaproteobacteria bacterium]|nr:ABC transporter substrate-binding protein [Betaproteobacteria bacterium]
MPEPPLRIASLVPSLTELLFALDLGANLVARTGFCVHPREQIRRVPKVGGTKDVDVDALFATRPTHVVVNVDENRKDAIEALRARVPTIVVTHPLVPKDNVVLYEEFGRLFDRRREAAHLAAAFASARDELEHAVRNAAQRSVLYLIWKDPWMTVSRPTYISSLLAMAKLVTLPAHNTRRYPALDADDAVWNEADVILVSSEPYAFRQKHADELSSKSASGPVLLVDGEVLSWYGSRAVAGLRYLKQLRAEIDALAS